MARVTLRLPDDLDDDIESYVGYGSKSEFYRQAAIEKLVSEGHAERSDYEDSDDEDDETESEATADA